MNKKYIKWIAILAIIVAGISFMNSKYYEFILFNSESSKVTTAPQTIKVIQIIGEKLTEKRETRYKVNDFNTHGVYHPKMSNTPKWTPDDHRGMYKDLKMLNSLAEKYSILLAKNINKDLDLSSLSFIKNNSRASEEPNQIYVIDYKISEAYLYDDLEELKNVNYNEVMEVYYRILNDLDRLNKSEEYKSSNIWNHLWTMRYNLDNAIVVNRGSGEVFEFDFKTKELALIPNAIRLNRSGPIGEEYSQIPPDVELTQEKIEEMVRNAYQ